MQGLKWIKLKTSMFDEEIFKLIEKMPEGTNILLIWIRLMMLAGKCNDSGFIYVTESIPYTDEMLAIILSTEVSIIRLALSAFEKFQMIEIHENQVIKIVDWESEQGTESLEKIREQNRIRKHKQRERERLLLSDQSECHGNDNVTMENCHVSSRDGHAIEEEREIEKEIDIDNINNMSGEDKNDLEKYSFFLSKELFNLIKLNNPNFKNPNLKTWAKHIELMVRVDKRNIQEILEVIRFSQKHSFWHINILSTDKLRQQYDRLYIEMINNNPQGGKANEANQKKIQKYDIDKYTVR